MMAAYSAPKFTGTLRPRSAHTSPVESVGCWIMECFEGIFQVPRYPDQRPICLVCPVGSLGGVLVDPMLWTAQFALMMLVITGAEGRGSTIDSLPDPCFKPAEVAETMGSSSHKCQIDR